MAASSSVGGADDNDESSESECAMLDVVGEVMWRTRVGAGAGSVTSGMALRRLRPQGDYLRKDPLLLDETIHLVCAILSKHNAVSYNSLYIANE